MSEFGLEQLQHLQPLLEHLQDTFVLLDPDGAIRYASGQARQLLGHRALHGDSVRLLGRDNYNQLCAPVLAGESGGARWREIQLKRRKVPALDLAASSMAVQFTPGRNGVLIILRDISGEVGLHRKYKALLKEQRDINRRLRQHIAAKLREHEDDIAQFAEILQLAPSIFNSFVGEARSALEATRELLTNKATEDRLVTGFRAMHTLKGNARSLGLNLIGGRAHSVEDLLVKIRDSNRPLRTEDTDALSELLDDLVRAIDRACDLRQRMGELIAQPSAIGPEKDIYQSLASLNSHLDAIETDLSNGRGEAALAELRETRQLLSTIGRIPLQTLFDYLAVTAEQVSETAGRPSPKIDIQCGAIAVSLSTYSALLTALPHIVRNAVIHGIEPADVRRARGKDPRWKNRPTGPHDRQRPT